MKIKKEELRIGNLLWEEYGGVYEVEGITQCGNVEMKKGGMTATGLYSIARLKPIELTEEWLLKFGYKKVNTLYDTTEVFEKDYSFTIYFRNGILSFSFKTIEIKYVHQLQNAVFYLDGQELTIK